MAFKKFFGKGSGYLKRGLNIIKGDPYKKAKKIADNAVDNTKPHKLQGMLVHPDPRKRLIAHTAFRKILEKITMDKVEVQENKAATCQIPDNRKEEVLKTVWEHIKLRLGGQKSADAINEFKSKLKEMSSTHLLQVQERAKRFQATRAVQIIQGILDSRR